MGTKNNPGAFDCYENAEDDEPMFVLLARDPDAPMLVRTWAQRRRWAGEDQAKIDEALNCALAMELWREAKRPPVTVAVHFVDGPWDGQTAGVSHATAPVFAVGHEVGNHYWLDTKSDPPTYHWDGKGPG